MKKRILAILLTVCMIASLLPAAALAAPEQEPQSTETTVLPDEQTTEPSETEPSETDPADEGEPTPAPEDEPEDEPAGDIATIAEGGIATIAKAENLIARAVYASATDHTHFKLIIGEIPKDAKTFSIAVDTGSFQIKDDATGFSNGVKSKTTSDATAKVDTSYLSVTYNGGSPKTALESLVFTCSSSSDVTVTISCISLDIEPGDIYLNGHIYQLSDSKYYWDKAMEWAFNDTALRSQYQGFEHYPATVTSTEENMMLVNFYTITYNSRNKEGIWIPAVPKGQGTEGPNLLTGESGSYVVTGRNAIQVKGHTVGSGAYYEWIEGTPEAGQLLPNNNTGEYTFWHDKEPGGGGASNGYNGANGPVWFGYEGAMWDDYGGFASFYGNNVSHYAVREYSPKADAEIATNTYEDTIKVGPSSTDEITNPPVDVLLDGNVTVADTTTASGIVTRVENGVVSIDPGKGESGTVTVKPNAGSLFTEDNITAFNNAYKNKGVTAALNEDGSVTLTFTKDYAGDESISFNSYMTRAEAKVGGEDCATVADALKKASEGENKTVQMQGSGFTAAKDLAVPDGVTLQDVDGNTVKGTGEGAKVSVDANGKLSVTGSAEVTLQDGKSATLAGSELSGVGGEASLTVTADGATLTGGSVSVPKNGAITANGKAITNNGDANVTVTKGQPTADDAKVVVPDGATVEVDGKTYPGPTVLVINSAGEVKENGPKVDGLTVQRDDEGKIATNGEAGTKERLTPVFMGVDPGAVYYWRINGAKTSLDRSLSRGTRTIRDPDGGVWYETVADNDGTLKLNTEGKTLVYGDYVGISGTPSHNDAVKYRLLSKELLNGGFESVSKGFDHSNYHYGNFKPRSEIYGWRTSASPNPVSGVPHYLVQLLKSGGNFASPWTTENAAELNGEEPASLYQEINTEGQKTFAWSLDYAGRKDGQNASRTQMMAVVIGPVKEDGQYQKSNAGTNDMFQALVSKLKTSGYTAPTVPGTMSGPYQVQDDASNNTYTIWVMYGKNGTFTHFADTIKTNDQKEMVFAFTAVEPTTGSEGNLLDNVMFQKPDPVYMVDGEPYATLKDALAAVKELGGDKDKTITITKPEYLGETLDGGTLPAGVTLVGVNGETYTTTDENGVELSVDSTGKVTVKGPAASADPEAATGGEAKVTVEPATGKSANFAVQGTTGAHDVEVSGKATVTVTEDASGNVTGATVAPETVTDPVTIDGVTYEAPTGSTGGEEGQAFAYDVDNPFAKAPYGTKATVPADKAKDTNFSLNVSGGTEGGFTVKPVDKGGEITVTKGNPDKTTTSTITDGEVKGAVEVNSTPATDPEGTASDGKVNVNGVEYTVPAGEDGEGSAKLGLVTKGTGEDGAKEDVVELLDGTVNVPNNGDIYVNNVDVENNGTGEITVTKDSPSEGKAQVDIPAETSVEIDGKPFIGEMSVVVDGDGKLSMAKGSTTLTGKELTEGKTEQSIDVTVSSPDGKSSGTVTVTNPSDNRSVEVKVPVSDDNPNGQATVQKGGSVKIGENEYTVPTDSGDKTYDDNNVFEFDSEGNVRIADGAVELADGQSVGFGSVELGNDETVNASGASKVTVEVVTPANSEDRGEAKVTVPEGETFTVTVTDENGEKQTYTYKNNGEGELELTVDGDGKVSVKGSDLPENGLELGPDTPITVTGDNGAENNLVAGAVGTNNEKGGATLKPNTKTQSGGTTAGKEVPLLDSGSVCFPDGKDRNTGKVTVKNGEEKGGEKLLDGKNVEVFASGTGAGNTVKSLGNSGDGSDGEVKVENGTKYYIPDNETADLNFSDGTFGAPAKGIIDGNKDGPGTNPFVLVPDENSKGDKEGNNDGPKLYTDNTDADDEGEGDSDSKKSNVFAEPGAGFNIKEKKPSGDGSTKDENLQDKSLGHYVGAGNGASLSVEHKEGGNGEVTLRDGSVKMERGDKNTVDPSVTVAGIGESKGKVTGDGVTVTTTKDADGKTGADVTVPANGKVDIDGKTYENAGTGELELHIDSEGNVSVKSGSAKLGDGDAVKLGEVTITGSDKDDEGNEPNVTVTVPADPTDENNKNAKVEVEKGGSVTIGSGEDKTGDKYTAAGEGNLELEVTPDGKVELESGAVTLPDPDSGEQKASVGVTAKGAGATGASKHYDVSGAGVTVTKDPTTGNASATTTTGGSVTVGEGENKTEYKAPDSKTAEVELTPTGPELKGGAVELDAASSSSSGKNESITVNGATVEATADGTPEGGKVTVKATTDETGKTTAEVDIPAGGKAKVNGVEITGEAKVTIDEDGSATVTPDAETGVVMDGKTYKKKDSADDNAKITIDKDGTINPEPAADFTIEITVPTTGPVHVGPGETVTFNDNGKTYTVTGGEEGGYFKVDKQDGGDCTITVTDKDGTPKSDAYKAADENGLGLTIDGEKAALTKGTVELADGESIGFGSATLGNGGSDTTDNSKVTVQVTEPTGEEGRKAKVTVPEGETFTVTVTGEDGKSETHTYKNNGTGNLELEVDENGNVYVKELPSDGLELGPNTPITLTDAPDGKSNPNPLTAGAQGATLKPHTRVDDATDKVTANNPPLLESGSVIFPDKTLDEEGNNTTLGQVNVKDPLGGGVEKRLEGNNVEVFAGNTSVKAKGSNDPDGGIDGEVTVEKGTKYTIPAGETSELSNGTFKAPAKGEITENKDGPGSHPYVIVPDEGNTGLFTDDAATGADSKVFAEAGSGFELKQKRVESSNKTESNLNPGSFGHYFGAEDGKGANVTVDHEQGTVTLTGGSLTMEKGAGTPNPEPSMYVQGIPEGSDENLKVTGDKVTVTKPRGNGSGADVTAENGEVTIGDKTYKNEAEGELGLYVDGNGNVGITKGEVTLTDKRGELPSIGVTAGSGEDIKDYEMSGEGVKIEAGTTGTDGKTENTKATVPAGGTLTVTDEDGNTNSYKNAGEGEMVVEFTENGPKLAEGSAELNVGEEIRVGNGGTEGADGTGTSVKNTGRGNITVNAGDGSSTNPSVDIPEDGSVELDNPNGCIEAEGKSVKVELNEDGTFSVELKPGDEVTINGRTYKNNDSKNGTIKVADDGTVTMDPEDVDIDESIKLPARNLKIPEGETYEYYVGAKKVEVKGGEGGGTVDIDRNGNVTGKDGNIEVRGDVKATVSPDAKTGTKVTQFGNIEMKVVDEKGNPVEDANVAVDVTVTRPDGKTEKLHGKTDENGNVVFEGFETSENGPELPYGTYSVTVTKTDENGNKYTTTGSVTVDQPHVSADADSFVLHDFVVTTNVLSDLPTPPAINGLGNIVTNDDKTDAASSNTTIDVTLHANASTQTDANADLDSEATDEYGEGAVVTDYIDVTIVKTTTKDGEEPVTEPVTDTKNLLTLSFKISGKLADRFKDGVTAENIFVLRQHDGKTDKMRKVSESAGKRANYECYYIQTFGSDVYIVIRAQYFSVYAFGVASDAIRTNDPGSGSTGSGSGGAVTTGENVKVPTVENGAVTVTPKNAKAGETVTITPTPNDGYETGSVTVTDKNGNTVEVTDNGDGTYSFVMPKSSAQPVTVNVTFEKTQSAAERFEDIYGNEWYAEYVEYVVANGMMDGMSPTKFGPHIITNRGMIVTILYRLEGKPAVTKNIPFEDVAPGMYYTDAVIWAEQNGIITGYNEKEYGPEGPVTREQAAAILGRYARYKGIDITATADLSGYTDADRISPYAVEFMKWAVENKIIDGTTPTTLDPRSGSTRAMLATILTRYCREIIEK